MSIVLLLALIQSPNIRYFMNLDLESFKKPVLFNYDDGYEYRPCHGYSIRHEDGTDTCSWLLCYSADNPTDYACYETRSLHPEIKDDPTDIHR